MANEFTGLCYQVALNWVVAHEDWVLVHGTVEANDGRRIDHAWCERDGEVVDLTLRSDETPFEKDGYIARANAIAEHYYSSEEASATGLVAKHNGPWTDEDRRKAAEFWQDDVE